MGNLAVAVMYFDHIGNIERATPRLSDAMLDFAHDGHRHGPKSFGHGAIVSWDHADGHQVVVVNANTGWRVGMDECPPPDHVLQACANALRAHGWSVKKPKD